MKNILLYLLWGIATISLFFYFSSKFIQDNFGSVTIPQLLLHVSMGTDNVNLSIHTIKSIIKYISFFIIYDSFLLYFTYKATKEKYFSYVIINLINSLYYIIITSVKKMNKMVPLCISILLAVSVYTIMRFEKRIHIIDYITQEESAFFAENYYKLDINDIISSDKNLIVIFIESLEDGYKEESVYGANLIQGLDDLKKEGISFNNYVKTPGAYFTLDGISAQLLGMPLVHIPISILDQNLKFKPLLKNTPSIFNLLKNMSYETVAFSGASRNFTQKGSYFETHGVDKFWGKEHWDEEGFGIDKANKNDQWGFNDEFLFNKLKEFLTYRTSHRKFAIFFETSDTHFPVGYVTDEDRRFNDMRDCFIRASRLTTEFIKWAKKQLWYKDTTIIIVGDHPWQDSHDGGTLNAFTKKSNNRQLYNLILNSEVQPVREITGWSSMDMAPTILNAMGIQFISHDVLGNASHSNIGIGVSLFSKKATLVEKYGQHFILKEIQKPSKFYDSMI